MINLLKNKSFSSLSLSTFFQITGISFFNILLLLLAKSANNSNIWVSIISIAAIIPGSMSIFMGKLSTHLKNKTSWIIGLTFIQGLLYILLSLVFHNNKFILVTAILINLFSDTLGSLISLIKIPIIQNKVQPEYQQQAIGFYQSIGLIMQPIGQAIGLYYISINHSYTIGSLINAGTFFISGLILFLFKKNLSFESEHSKNSNEKHTFSEAFKLFSTITELPIINILLSLIILNSLGTSIDGILNLYILNHSEISQLNFGTIILIINIIFVTGNILGAVIVHDFMHDYTIKKLIVISCLNLILLYTTLIFNLGLFMILISLFLLTYTIGKLNPKLYALLMKNTSSESLSLILGTLNTSLTIAAPMGSIILVGGYTILGKNTILYTSLSMVLATLIIINLKNYKYN